MFAFMGPRFEKKGKTHQITRFGKNKKIKTASRSKMAEGAETEITADLLKNLTLADLRNLAERRGLETNGTKAELLFLVREDLGRPGVGSAPKPGRAKSAVGQPTVSQPTASPSDQTNE